MQRIIRYLVVVLLMMTGMAGPSPVSSSEKSPPAGVEKHFIRYQELMRNLDLRRKYQKEFKDLYIFFNYGEGSRYPAVVRPALERASGESGTGTVPLESSAARGIEMPPSIVKSKMDLEGGGGGRLYAVVDQKLRELGVPDLYRKYLSVENWQANLDQDAQLETIVAVRLSLDIGSGKRTSFGFVCPRKDMAHVIILIDPARSAGDEDGIYTLTQQKHVTDSCDCVGCLSARLVDVYDFEADGMSEIVTHESIYGTGHFKVYGHREDRGYIILSYHPPSSY